MSFDARKLYELLPAVYRLRDAGEQGGALEALLAVIAEQVGVVEENLAQLYDDQFIETCAPWVVPYVGDLLKVRGLYSVNLALLSQRARVANTIRYRRRKGTATMLEQLARDTTGWPARAVEFFEIIGTTQNSNHIRLQNLQTPDLRQGNQLELLDTPFETISHTVDVRHIASGRGKHNIPNIGLFLWRLQAYPIKRATASSLTKGLFSFGQLGNAVQLFNVPQPETDITHIAEEVNVPGKLRRRLLYDELEAWRQALVDGKKDEKTKENLRKESRYFGEDPVLEVLMQMTDNGPYIPVDPENLAICDLRNAAVIPDTWVQHGIEYRRGRTEEKEAFLIKAAVDPVLGRILFPQGREPKSAAVSYAYGFSGDIGGGPYDRRDSVGSWISRSENGGVTWQIGVVQDRNLINDAPDATQLVPTLSKALEAWENHAAGTPDPCGLIVIMDNGTYTADAGGYQIKIPAGSKLGIVAGDWPFVKKEDQEGVQRVVGQVVASGLRPHIKGDISITGIKAGTREPGELMLDGLLIEGKVTVEKGKLGSLRLSHSTLVPKNGGLGVEPENSHLTISLVRCVCGPVVILESITKLSIEDSIVDADSGKALEAEKTDADLQACTFFGSAAVGSIRAGNCLFTGLLTAVRKQDGCVRFSYLPDGSEPPRSYHCQPYMALLASRPRDRDQVLVSMKPVFTSRTYGNPGYAQLSAACPEEILAGADNGSEMGAFGFLMQPQRKANLKACLDEYLRFGLEAGIFYVT